MIPAEAAHDTISALGDLGMLQFKDLASDKNAFQRTFASQIKRCDEMARQLRFLAEEVGAAGLPLGSRLGERDLAFDELESRLGRLEQEVTELNANTERLNRRWAARRAAARATRRAALAAPFMMPRRHL
jgi:V-type H+-transporting ATPase subunit a